MVIEKRMMKATGIFAIVTYTIVAAALFAAGVAIHSRITRAARPVDSGPADCSTGQSCCATVPKHLGGGHPSPTTQSVTQPSTAGMVWLNGGEFDMGGNDPEGRADER